MYVKAFNHLNLQHLKMYYHFDIFKKKNICYANCVIQILFFTDTFRENILDLNKVFIFYIH